MIAHPSSQQLAVRRWFADRSTQGPGATPAPRNLLVRARAGTGKTTTILDGVEHAPERRILLAAFNKRIADELQKRVTSRHIEAKTLHGVGFKFIARNWRGVQVDKFRTGRHAAEVLGDDRNTEIGEMIAKLARLGKECAPAAAEPGDLLDLAEAFDCVPDEEKHPQFSVRRICTLALATMERALVPDRTIDFSDMLYLPLRLDWVQPCWDLVVVDEAQDMNVAQLSLAQLACTDRGRICVVGDDRQGIYTFRGADATALDRIKGELGAHELGLTTTYRCPKAITAEAARIVPDFHAADTAPEGVIRSLSERQMLTDVAPGDFVLSRKNAPLASVCLSLLQAGVRARIEGADLGKGLIAIVKRFMAAPDMPAFLARVVLWSEREAAAARARKSAEREELVRDQAEMICALAEGVEAPADLVYRIEDLFANDGRPAVVCSSVHRAKGLEAPRVYLLRWTFHRGGPRDLTDREECNIEYVAITRAQRELVWVSQADTAATQAA